MISLIELQIVTIINFKPHRLRNSSIHGSNGTKKFFPCLDFDGVAFCSLSPGCNGSTFCFTIVDSDEATICFYASKLSPPFFSLLPLAITTLNIKKNTISLLIINSDELALFATKGQEKKEKKTKKVTNYNCCLLCNKTTEKGKKKRR